MLRIRAVGVDHEFHAAISGLARRGRIADDRMISAVADQKELVGLHPRPRREIVEHRHRPRHGELMRRAELLRGLAVIGMPFDADDLIGIGTLQLGGRGVEHGRSVGPQSGRAGLE